MAVADTARLIASLELQDKFTATATKIEGSLGRLEKRSTLTARAMSTAIGVGLERVAEKGVSVLVGAVEGGISSLESLQSATSSVDGAIKQMGLTGQVTAGQVAGWANEIEDAVGAAFDDKAITKATTTLIRFGRVTPTNLRPAMQVMTDLATKTGSVDSAAALLARALADPEKAAGKLARAGVVLTKAQQDELKAMVKAGDAAGAQRLLLDDLTTATKGAALASQGEGARGLAQLHDAIEDAQRALAEGLLPVIDEARSKITSWLKDPQNLQRIRDFGKFLADGFRAVVEFAGKIPWSTIGDALKIGGAGAKAVLDAFVAMPAWVQTAVITGWGLNKLSGGNLSGLIGELGKGLVKGVLGMNAGVVNINAGVVNGAGGGLPGGGTSLVPGLGLGAAIPVVLTVGTIAALAAAFVSSQQFTPTSSHPSGFGRPNANTTRSDLPGLAHTNEILNTIAYREQRLGEISGGKLDIIAAHTNEAIDAVERARAAINQKQEVANSRLLHSTDYLEEIRNKRWQLTSRNVVNVKITNTGSQYRISATTSISGGTSGYNAQGAIKL